ncbi:hypothetical protein [Plantactinospora sp. CA-290183]|uniref:hypothetical protein n=1 Tax=Plantactinospora sp. CA-290183 TaxID=3240006 RepID=UPI003D8FEEC6
MGATGPFSGATEPGSAREEAERLVATALVMARAAASEARNRAGALGPLGQLISDVLDHDQTRPGATGPTTTTAGPATAGPAAAGPAAAGHPGAGADGTGSVAGFATGAPECCVCPVCRVISAMRDPSPEFTERLATGAGDFAAGVASLLRAFSTVAGPTGARTDASTGNGSSAGRPGTGGDEMWREATRTGHDSWPADGPDVWASATRADLDTGAADGPEGPASTGADGAAPGVPPTTGRPPVPTSRAPQAPAGVGDQEIPGDRA